MYGLELMVKKWIVVSMLSAAAACGGSDKKEQEPEVQGRYSGETVLEDGTIKSGYDLNGDGEFDVTKFQKDIPDADDPSVTKRVLLRKEMDLNYDKTIDVVRHYDDFGVVLKEEVDTNLDGKFDVVNHMENGALVKKELLNSDAETITTTRFYSNGQIVRVEADKVGDDGKVDYWEFYEQGVLDRIGRDLDGDGRADTWQTR